MESEVKEIRINGVDYIPKDSVVEKEINSDIKIVVLQRGWIVVGRFERKDTQCKLHNASVIRSWGTTWGLGEIAEGGLWALLFILSKGTSFSLSQFLKVGVSRRVVKIVIPYPCVFNFLIVSITACCGKPRTSKPFQPS